MSEESKLPEFDNYSLISLKSLILGDISRDEFKTLLNHIIDNFDSVSFADLLFDVLFILRSEIVTLDDLNSRVYNIERKLDIQ